MTARLNRPEFANIFGRLRDVLSRYASSLSVAEDSPTRYCLEGRVGPATLKAWGGKLKQRKLPVAWVQVGKGYVSYHLMPVYWNPQALKGMSPALRARMQGKSCFNFKVPDEALFQELETLTERTCQAFKRAGFVE